MALLLNRGGDSLLEAGRFGKRECCNWRGGNDGVFARRSHKNGATLRRYQIITRIPSSL